jgi:hypothetical protein
VGIDGDEVAVVLHKPMAPEVDISPAFTVVWRCSASPGAWESEATAVALKRVSAHPHKTNAVPSVERRLRIILFIVGFSYLFVLQHRTVVHLTTKSA